MVKKTFKEKTENTLFRILGSIRPKLNLKAEMSVKGAAGVAHMICDASAIYQLCQEKPNDAVVGGCIAGSLAFAGVYIYLDSRDRKLLNLSYAHEEKMAKIKHPKANDGIIETLENSRPRYLEPYDNPPVAHSLNELAKSTGHELYPLAGIYVYEGDIAIFFSIANKGKTIAAIQLAIDMAKGESTLFNMEKPPRRQNVWYYNFEMSEAQMKKRLTQEDGTAIEFPDNILMIDCKGRYESADKFINSLALDVEHKITGNTVIFIDTITDICPSFFSKEVSHVLNSLRTIQEHVKREKCCTLTFVIESHTQKITDSEPLGFDNMKGGVNQSNLADSVFALGVAHGKKNLRYMKVLKARNDEIPDTVDILEIAKTFYVRPHFVGTAREEDVLPQRKKPSGKGFQTETVREPLNKPKWKNRLASYEQAIAIKTFKEEGHSLKETRLRFGLNYDMQVSRIISELETYQAQEKE